MEMFFLSYVNETMYLLWDLPFFKMVLPQFSSVAQLCPTLCNPLDSMPGLPVHHQLPELAQTHVHWVGDAIQLSHPLLSLSPPAFNLSQHQGLFQWVSSSHQVTQVLGVSASTSVLPMNTQDWFDLPAVQQTLTSLLQYHSSKASSLWNSAFSMVQLSQLSITAGKTMALSRWTFVSKLMSLLFNMLSLGWS